ncbi:hypothetical protein D3C86_1443050 [compost metagenome]
MAGFNDSPSSDWRLRKRRTLSFKFRGKCFDEYQRHQNRLSFNRCRFERFDESCFLRPKSGYNVGTQRLVLVKNRRHRKCKNHRARRRLHHSIRKSERGFALRKSSGQTNIDHHNLRNGRLLGFQCSKRI